ncbi:MAG: hypothetical protein R2809_00645 [Flavobacteriales bacterium]
MVVIADASKASGSTISKFNEVMQPSSEVASSSYVSGDKFTALKPSA